MRVHRHVEVGVVGAGIVGLATTLALRDAGSEVVCFEVGRPGNGQSAGETRVFRHLHEHDLLIGLAKRARVGWLDWEARGSTELLGHDGVLRFDRDVAAQCVRLQETGVQARVLRAEEQREVLPGLISSAPEALFEVQAGAIRARRAVELLTAWLDDEIVNAGVFGVERAREGVRLATAEGTWLCDRVLLCAGVATPGLASELGIKIQVRVACHPRVTFALHERRGRARLACLQDSSRVHGETVYACPSPAARGYAIGLIGPDSDAPWDPATGLGSAEIDARVDRIVAYASRVLPALLAAPVSVRLCHTTKLGADKDAFAVWAEERVTAIAGNNLFKFAPILGRELAKAAIREEIPASLPCPDPSHRQVRVPASGRVIG